MIDLPENIKKYYDDQLSEITSVELFSKPNNSWLLDIWVAAKFGELFNQYIEPCLVEVDEKDSQSYYDFRLRIGAETIPFQATEAMEYERRRGAEYKAGESLFDQAYWQKSTVEPYEYVGRAIEKKLKRYGSGASDINLVVYANLFGFDEQFDDVLEYCQESAIKFKSVWLFSSNVFGALYENSELYYPYKDWVWHQS